MSLQYVVYDYWEYGYAEGDAILEFGSASVSAVATVSANGIRVQTAAGAITGNATVSAFGTRIQFGDAAVNASAVLTADGTRVQTGSGAITGTASVTALGGVVYSGIGAVYCQANVSAYPNATWSVNAAVNANVSLTANGQIVGEEWSDVVPTANNWTEQTVVENNWNIVNPENKVWFSNKLSDPYVEIDYWVDGYADDRYDYWVKSGNVQNNWARQ